MDGCFLKSYKGKLNPLTHKAPRALEVSAMRKTFITALIIAILCLSMLTVFTQQASSQIDTGPVIDFVSMISATRLQTIEIRGYRLSFGFF